MRIDNFLITLGLADGTLRTIRRDGDGPKIEIKDPLEAHKALLAILTDKDMHDVTAYLATLEMTFKKLLVARLAAPRAGRSCWRRDRGSIPPELLKPLADAWPTYNGDYSGKRYSALTQINRRTSSTSRWPGCARLTGRLD